MGVSKNNGTPQISHFNRVFHDKPSILGYPYFWKHPYTKIPKFKDTHVYIYYLPFHLKRQRQKSVTLEQQEVRSRGDYIQPKQYTMKWNTYMDA